MKSLYILILICTLPILIQAQTPEIRQFFRQQKIKDDAVKVFLPGWIIRMGVGIAGKEIGAEKKLVKEAVRPMHNLRVLTLENPTESQVKSVKKMAQHAKDRKFKEFLMIRDKGSSINIMMKDKLLKKSGARIVKRLLVLVAEEDEVVIVSLKGRWNLQKLLKEMKGLDILQKQDKIQFPLGKDRPQA